MLKNYVAASAMVLALSTPAFAQMNDFRMESMQSNAFEVQSAQIALQKSRNGQVRSYAKDALRDHRAANVALAGGANGAMAAQDGGPIGGLIGAPLAVAGGAVGAGLGAATGAVGGTLSGGPVGGLQGVGNGAAQGAATGSRLGGGMVEDTGGTTLVPPNPQQQAMLAELSSTPAGPRFDRLYVQQQVQSHQMAIGMTQAYAQGGPNPALRTYAQQVLPSLQEHYGMLQRMPGAM
ncbi:DUF4142 domain-containing protein [Methylobacterium sp. J-076]|uniref:DUF4142 domain-containing protein n=1 Tax=Methylobacterium sp. J-076 TaxID=2836655 RepID=UPI001FBAA156|nr:DUF4142 domain-containing protein [Methylobacterium sp. J-076]MCJ2014353.1 DUF4142 domain-containing protein [Methylobacterium sp. J-076]